MTRKESMILALAAGVCIAVVVAFALGLFDKTPPETETRQQEGGSTQTSEAASSSAGEEGSFRISIVQRVDAKVELNRFKYPYREIASKADYASLVGVLAELPDSRFSADAYTIFRTSDQVAVAFGKEEDAISGGNTGLLAIPNDAIDALGGPEAAFKFYYDSLQQNADP